MSKRRKGFSRGFSVRHSRGDVLKVEVFSDNRIVFKGTAPIGDVEKVRALFLTMKAKGVDIPIKGDGWW